MWRHLVRRIGQYLQTTVSVQFKVIDPKTSQLSCHSFTGEGYVWVSTNQVLELCFIIYFYAKYVAQIFFQGSKTPPRKLFQSQTMRLQFVSAFLGHSDTCDRMTVHLWLFTLWCWACSLNHYSVFFLCVCIFRWCGQVRWYCVIIITLLLYPNIY